MAVIRDSGKAAALPTKRSPRKARRWRWVVWLLGLVLVAAIGWWAAQRALAAKVQATLVEGLAKRGLFLRHAARSWSFWSELRLTDVVLYRDAADGPPLAALSALSVDVPLLEVLKNRGLIIRWRADDASLKLYDAAGEVTFAHCTTAVVLASAKIEIPRLKFQHGGVAAALAGTILLAPHALDPSTDTAPVTWDLSVLRSVLAVLDFKAEKNPFLIEGSYALDFRGKAAWRADLAGAGQAVEWQGVPLREASAKAQLSDAGLKLTSSLQFTQGSAKASVSLADWDGGPILVGGQLADADGHADDFSASYDSAARTVVLRSLSGRANLWQFARNFPMLAPHLDESVDIQIFPDLAVKDLAWSFDKTGTAWTLGSFQTRSPANVTIRIRGEPLQLEAVQGGATFADEMWTLDLMCGRLVWRGVEMRGVKSDTTLAASRIQSSVSLQFATGAASLEVSGAGEKSAPWNFAGSITDAHGYADRVAGSYEPESAALRVARLEGKANLLELVSNFPGIAERIPKNFQLQSFPEIAVQDFVFQPGRPASLGALRVVSPADVSVLVKRSPLVIADLTGAVAFDGKAWKFSQTQGRALGGTFALAGTYDDGALRQAQVSAANLRLRELKPWLGRAQESLGEASLSFDYAGTICHEPSQLSGAGHLRLENAPVVQVPLLDQTYELFSALVSVVPRRGMGSITATFTSDKGVADIPQFAARSDAVTVTATGTLDLVHGKISGHARGNLRGLAGLITSPLSHTMEMEVSGSLDNIRVRPIGIGGIFMRKVKGKTAAVPQAAKGARLTGSVVRDGVALPLRALKLFEREASERKPSPAE